LFESDAHPHAPIKLNAVLKNDTLMKRVWCAFCTPVDQTLRDLVQQDRSFGTDSDMLEGVKALHKSDGFFADPCGIVVL